MGSPLVIPFPCGQAPFSSSSAMLLEKGLNKRARKEVSCRIAQLLLAGWHNAWCGRWTHALRRRGLLGCSVVRGIPTYWLRVLGGCKQGWKFRRKTEWRGIHPWFYYLIVNAPALSTFNRQTLPFPMQLTLCFWILKKKKSSSSFSGWFFPFILS